MYRLEFQKQPRKILQKIPKSEAQRIIAKLKLLANDPYAQNNNVAKLKDQPGYPLRVRDWRVIYTIFDDEIFILVVRIAPRGDVYK